MNENEAKEAYALLGLQTRLSNLYVDIYLSNSFFINREAP